MANKVIDAVGRLLSRLPAERRLAKLRDGLLRTERGRARSIGSDAIVAIECVENPVYFGLMSSFALALERAAGATPELVFVRSINGAVGTGWLHAIARSWLVSSIVMHQWQRAFTGLINRVAYRSQSLAHPLGDIADWWCSRAMWKQLRTSSDISAMRIGGVQVGDLINDSYLRFRPSPRFDAADPFLKRLLWQAHRDVRRARSYFGHRKPKLYLTTYSTYIEHGIAARVALQEGVPVWSFGSFNQFGKKLSLEDWMHTPDCRGYRRDFAALDRQDERLAEAEHQLGVRLAGGIDTATSYMKVSAYAAAPEPAPEVRGAVVVFLHDFYDSPHVYHDLVFPDFWVWVCFTVETLRDAGLPCFLKPHPNQISLSDEALGQLASRYPDLRLLSPRVTNAQLVEGGMLCGVTVYGTVAHELAYLGCPTIACARHPHSAFEFCRTARTADEYAAFLRSPARLPVDRAEMRRQALAFYYMHNLHGDAECLALRQAFIIYWQACHDPLVKAEELVEHLDALRSSAGFAQVVRALAQETRSHD